MENEEYYIEDNDLVNLLKEVLGDKITDEDIEKILKASEDGDLSEDDFDINLGFDIADYPNAYAYFENEITLPLHTSLTGEDVEYVIECYTEIVKGYI